MGLLTHHCGYNMVGVDASGIDSPLWQSIGIGLQIGFCDGSGSVSKFGKRGPSRRVPRRRRFIGGEWPRGGARGGPAGGDRGPALVGGTYVSPSWHAPRAFLAPVSTWEVRHRVMFWDFSDNFVLSDFLKLINSRKQQLPLGHWVNKLVKKKFQNVI